jgi:hypothetical protein
MSAYLKESVFPQLGRVDRFVPAKSPLQSLNIECQIINDTTELLILPLTVIAAHVGQNRILWHRALR